jgi:hypothetical protein
MKKRTALVVIVSGLAILAGRQTAFHLIRWEQGAARSTEIKKRRGRGPGRKGACP